MARAHLVALWMPPVQDRQQTKNGMTELFRLAMHVFFSRTDFNMSTTGFRLKNPNGNAKSSIHTYGSMAACAIDGKGIKVALEVKGSSGLKPCFRCANCVSTTRDITNDPYLVDYKTAKLQDCIQHTDDSFWAVVDDLAAKKTTLSDAQFGELEIAHFVKYQ